MHFVVSRNSLKQELSIAQEVVEKKTTIPILVNVLLKVEDNLLKITATDLDVTYHSKIPVNMKTSGSATVMAAKLYEIFSLLPEGDAEIKLMENGRFHISLENINYDLAILPEEDYPKVPFFDERKGIEVNYKLLQEGLVRTLPSVSTEEYRYQLGGICFRLNEEGLEMASTDGHRLSRVVIECKGKEKYNFEETIVPRKACAELSKIEGEEKVLICNQEQFTAFIFNDKQIIARKIMHKFPDYKGYLLEKGDKTFTVGRDELYRAVRRVSVISLGKYYGIKLFLTNDNLKLDGTHPDIGEAVENIKVSYKGEPFQITFNANYLLDFLNTISSTNITVYFKDVKSKATFIPEEKDLSHIYILMPMTV